MMTTPGDIEVSPFDPGNHLLGETPCHQTTSIVKSSAGQRLAMARRARPGRPGNMTASPAATRLAVTPGMVKLAIAELRTTDHLVTDAEFADVLWTELETQALAETVAQDVMRAFGVNAYDIGLAPVPTMIRIRRRITRPFLRAWYRLTGL